MICEICNKVKRVCREDGCNGECEHCNTEASKSKGVCYYCEKVVDNATIIPTIAKNATVDEKCSGFVNSHIDYDYPIMLRVNHSLSDDEIKQIEEAINSMFRIF